MKNLFKLSYQLVFRGKWAVKILTVLLSAFSFALFALASTAYTYSEKDYILRNILYDLVQSHLLYFHNSHSEDRYILQPEDVSLIKETFPSLDFLYNCENTITYYLYVGNYVEIDQNNLNMDDIYAHEAWWGHVRDILSFNTTDSAIVATPELFDEAGYEILEGRYPTAENEIAIDLSLYEVFEWGGYSPSESEAAVEIHDYSDMLGKSLGTNEIIVGVYDINSIVKSDWLQRRTETLVIRSEAWRTEQKQERVSIEFMFVPDVSDLVNYQFAEQCLEVTQTMIERYYERFPNKIGHNISSIGANHFGSYLNDVGLKAGFVNQNVLAFIFGCAGIVFLIFSVILNSYIITALMGKKQKEIGLLRALGTPKKKIAEIFILGILYLAAIIFILALILSSSVYFGILEPWLTNGGEIAVPVMQYSGWTVLILFAVSFITPVLSVLLPIKKFFRSSVIENIKGTTSKKGEKSCLK